jgi:UDP-glucuronate 4-epimerase
VPTSTKILITGAAGFIGFHLARRLCQQGFSVVGLDNLNDYYDPKLKNDRLALLREEKTFEFALCDLADHQALNQIFLNHHFSAVINLAAQAGVRYSITNPYAYLESNFTGFLNLLECCRYQRPSHLIYASSSSVYGANTKMPFSVHHNVDHPLALYAASKKANELMAHAYSNLYQLPTTGLRFFTVYGPWGRPDMALFLFTKAILEGKPIDIYNEGKMRRDFTYIDDIVESIVRLIPLPAQPNKNWSGNAPDAATSFAPYRIFNIGNSSPVDLMHFIEVIEDKLEKKAVKNFLPLQQGDVVETFADVTDLEALVGFRPSTSVEQGIERFVDWYKHYYHVA